MKQKLIASNKKCKKIVASNQIFLISLHMRNFIDYSINILLSINKNIKGLNNPTKKLHRKYLKERYKKGHSHYYLDLDSACLASSGVDGNSSTYLDPIVILSLDMAFLASSAESNSTNASPVAFPSGRQAM